MSAERIFIVFDTEGTGLTRIPKTAINVPASVYSRGSEVCQIGGIILNNQMQPLKLFCHYCDTVAPESSSGAISVHGISQRVVRRYLTGQYLPEIIERWLPEFLWNDVVFVGYNAEFDMDLVAQTMANSPINFTWKRFIGSIVPKHGRFSIDVGDFVKIGDNFRKLSSFEKELEWQREAFLSRYSRTMSIDTNCIEMLHDSWEKAHNSFFDALNTYLLWSDRVWKKKLL